MKTLLSWIFIYGNVKKESQKRNDLKLNVSKMAVWGGGKGDLNECQKMVLDGVEKMWQIKRRILGWKYSHIH